MKRMLEKFRGDTSWVPCGSVDAEFDVSLLVPQTTEEQALLPDGADDKWDAVLASGAVITNSGDEEVTVVEEARESGSSSTAGEGGRKQALTKEVNMEDVPDEGVETTEIGVEAESKRSTGR